MPDDGAGNHNLTPGYLAVTGEKVLASQHNPPLQDLSQSMTARLMRDGRSPMLGNLPMNGFRITGMAPGVDPTDALTVGQYSALSFNDVPDGTASAPGLSFASDDDTGIWRVGANQIGFSVGATNIATVSSTGIAIVGNLVVTGTITVG